MSDPDIVFDSRGVCHHCHQHAENLRNLVFSAEDGRRRLQVLADSLREQGRDRTYDCLIGVSGGVDSTYVAWLVRQLGLRPLAVHLDNGWNSDIAVRNISNALGKLGIDLHTHVIDWEEFKDIQRSFLLASVPDVEVPTDHAILACLYREAKRFRIPAIIIGTNTRTESHLPPAWSRGHRDWGYIRTIHRTFGSGAIRTFPHLGFYDFLLPGRNRPRNLEFLNYVDYDKEVAKATITRELGWQDYGGKHFESVFTRWYQGCYLPRKFGFDKRRTHLSSLISTGQVSRESALETLRHPPYDPAKQDADCEYVAKKLGFSSVEFSAIMAAAPKRFEDYWSFSKRIDSSAFRYVRALARRVRAVAREVTSFGHGS